MNYSDDPDQELARLLSACVFDVYTDCEWKLQATIADTVHADLKSVKLLPFHIVLSTFPIHKKPTSCWKPD